MKKKDKELDNVDDYETSAFNAGFEELKVFINFLNSAQTLHYEAETNNSIVLLRKSIIACRHALAKIVNLLDIKDYDKLDNKMKKIKEELDSYRNSFDSDFDFTNETKWIELKEKVFDAIKSVNSIKLEAGVDIPTKTVMSDINKIKNAVGDI